jgi:hypothetical protein
MRRVRLDLDLVEVPVLALGISDGELPRVPALKGEASFIADENG